MRTPEDSASRCRRQIAPPAHPHVAFGADVPTGATPTARLAPLASDPRQRQRMGCLLLRLEADGLPSLELTLPSDRVAAFALATDAASPFGLRIEVAELLRQLVRDAGPPRPSRRLIDLAGAIGRSTALPFRRVALAFVAGRMRRKGITVVGARLHPTAAYGCGRGRTWPSSYRYRAWSSR